MISGENEMAQMIYSKTEIKRIMESGKILKETLNMLGEKIKHGVSTYDLDKLAYDNITKYNAYPVFLGYNDFPASICVSINEEIIHGIPSKEKIIKEGDIVSIDLGVQYNGYIADAAYTFGVGKISPDADKLMKITYNGLYKGIKAAVVGNRVGDIGYAVQSYVESYGYSVIRDYVGHGVGKELHEEPQVPNFGKQGTGRRLKEGMVIAIEPMVAMGNTYEVIVKEDGWTVITADNSLAAHFEHSIAITDNEPVILTI